MKNRLLKVNEARRTIVDVANNKHVLRNVTSVDFGGNWLRLQSDEGYVIVNPDNVVLMYVEPATEADIKR